MPTDAWLAAQVAKPQVNLTRIHGVFATTGRYQELVTKLTQDRGGRRATLDDPEAPARE